jgi:hypothetical protein
MGLSDRSPAPGAARGILVNGGRGAIGQLVLSASSWRPVRVS